MNLAPPLASACKRRFRVANVRLGSTQLMASRTLLPGETTAGAGGPLAAARVSMTSETICASERLEESAS